VNYSSTHSFYDRDFNGRRINETMWKNKGRLTRLEGANLALNFRFSGGKGGKQTEEAIRQSEALTQEEQTMLTRNRDSYVDFSVPWNFNMGYNLRLARTWDVEAQRDRDQVTQAITFNGDVTIFKNWAVSTITGYDFNAKELTTTSVSLHWMIHCWELSANVVPFGLRKSYMVQLNIRSSLLKDLKLQRRGNLGNPELLY
jgi:outer membrane usher protein FimD/PapC